MLVSAQTQSEPVSCLQSCRRQMEENCATYPDSPVCPSDITRRCELNCQLTTSVNLNEDFTLDVGRTIKVKNYDNMEVTLLAIKRTGARLVTADLKIKKGNEAKFVSINSKDSRKASKEVFGVRLDFVTFIAEYPTGYVGGSKEEDYKAAIFSKGAFGVYEKRVGGFWSRVSDWIKGLFR